MGFTAEDWEEVARNFEEYPELAHDDSKTLWLLRVNLHGNVYLGQYVVRAESEHEARRTLYGSTREEAWLDAKRTQCTSIPLDGPTEVVVDTPQIVRPAWGRPD